MSIDLSIPAAALVHATSQSERYYIYEDVNVIGRNKDAFICLEDTFISRKHCIIEKSSENKFTICDVSSRGTFINGKQLKKNKAVKLHHNDSIMLANVEPYTYIFRINKKNMESKEDDELSTHLKEKMIDLSNTQCDEVMKLDEEIYQMGARKSGLKEELNRKLEAQENLFQEELLKFSNLLSSTNEQKIEAERNLKEMEEKSKAEKEKFLQEIERKIAEITKKEEELQKTKDEMELRHQVERENLEERCKAEVEELKIKLAASEMEQGRLQDETRGVEQQLKETKKILLDCELEQHRLFEEKMETETKLESKIVDLTKESTSKGEVVKELEKKLKEKEEAEEKIRKEIEGLEDEVQCSICAELYIEATALNCGHMFCKMCIDEWKKKKKICPMCRAKISTTIRIFNVDTLIEKNVALMSEEAKKRRKAMIKERQSGKSLQVPVKKRKHHHHQTFLVQPSTSTAPTLPMVIEMPHLNNSRRIQMDIDLDIDRSVMHSPFLHVNNRAHASNPVSQQSDPFTWSRHSRAGDRARLRSTQVFSPVSVAAIDLTNIAVNPGPSGVRTPPSTTSSSLIDLTTP